MTLDEFFAWIWIPGRYIKSDVPLVLSVSLPAQDGLARWKEIVEPARGRYMYHFELRIATRKYQS